MSFPDRYAILIDGEWFKKNLHGKSAKSPTAQDIFSQIEKIRTHCKLSGIDLYRIFYYTADPFEGSVRNPLNKESTEYSLTPPERSGRPPTKTWSLSLSKCPYLGIPSTHAPPRHDVLGANVPPVASIECQAPGVNRCRSGSFVSRPANDSRRQAWQLPQDDRVSTRAPRNVSTSRCGGRVSLYVLSAMTRQAK